MSDLYLWEEFDEEVVVRKIPFFFVWQNKCVS